MKPGSNRNYIHDIIAVCSCKNRDCAYYDGDTQTFICGECGCYIQLRAGEMIPYTTNAERERIAIYYGTSQERLLSSY